MPEAADLIHTARRLVLDVEHAEALAQRITSAAVSLYDPHDLQRRKLALRVEGVGESFLGLLEDPLLALDERLQGAELWTGPIDAVRASGQQLLDLGDRMVRQSDELTEVAEEARRLRPSLREPARLVGELSSELRGHGVTLSGIGERLRTLPETELGQFRHALARSTASSSNPTGEPATPGQRSSGGR